MTSWLMLFILVSATLRRSLAMSYSFRTLSRSKYTIDPATAVESAPLFTEVPVVELQLVNVRRVAAPSVAMTPKMILFIFISLFSDVAKCKCNYFF